MPTEALLQLNRDDDPGSAAGAGRERCRPGAVCASPVATSIATSPSAGNWTSAQDSNNLNGSLTYYAQAVQGSTTSAVFTFSTTGL
jgi:hypothetical protein